MAEDRALVDGRPGVGGGRPNRSTSAPRTEPGDRPRPGAPQALDPGDLQRLVRDPSLDPDRLDSLAENPDCTRLYEIRAAIALHPRTPLRTALRLTPTLGWRDLARIAMDARRAAALRARADALLARRAGDLAAGEQAALARLGGRSVIKILLRAAADARVLVSLLDNPRLVEDEAVDIARSPLSPIAVLSALARHERWKDRLPVRLALAQNPRCPAVDALHCVAGLDPRELQALSTNPLAPRLTRVSASRRLDALGESDH